MHMMPHHEMPHMMPPHEMQHDRQLRVDMGHGGDGYGGHGQMQMVESVIRHEQMANHQLSNQLHESNQTLEQTQQDNQMLSAEMQQTTAMAEDLSGQLQAAETHIAGEHQVRMGLVQELQGAKMGLEERAVENTKLSVALDERSQQATNLNNNLVKVEKVVSHERAANADLSQQLHSTGRQLVHEHQANQSMSNIVQEAKGKIMDQQRGEASLRNELRETYS